MECTDGPPPCGFDDGSYVGVEICAPLGTEAVCDLAEGDAGPQRPLRAVIGRRDGPIGEEDEQVSPTALDDLLELAAGRMGRGDAHQAVELGVELVGIAAQCGVGELLPPFADGAGALEQFAQAGREGAVAGVDGVLGIADEVGEAT